MGKEIVFNLCNKVTDEKVGCIVEIIYGNKKLHRLSLVADMDRVIKTVNYCWVTSSINPNNAVRLHSKIVGLKNNPLEFQEMCNVVLTYIGYSDVVRAFTAMHKDESIGFLIKIYSDDHSKTKIIPKTWKEIENLAGDYFS